MTWTRFSLPVWEVPMNVPAELLMVLILAVALAFAGGMVVAAMLATRSNQNLLHELQGLKERVEEVRQKAESLANFPELHARLDQARNELTRLSETLNSVRGFLSDTVHQQVTRQIEETLKTLTRLEEKLRSTSDDQIARLEKQIVEISAILLGRRGGAAAERIVDELLSVFPEGWVKQNVHLGGGKVEFAVVLPGDYYVPLDSKFVGAEILAKQDYEADQKKSQKIQEKIKEQAKKIVEYLRDPKVPGFGIAAVPDSVYAMCRSAIREVASEHQVVVVPYSLLVPFVLSLYLIAQRLGISVRSTDTSQLIGSARDALRRAREALENMEKEINTVRGQRDRALDELRNAERALNALIGDGPPEVGDKA
jgi:DNA anti-recombination protein RmuC